MDWSKVSLKFYIYTFYVSWLFSAEYQSTDQAQGKIFQIICIITAFNILQ